jgi:hypothetical protein
MRMIKLLPFLVILLFVVSCAESPQGIEGKSELQVTVLQDDNTPVANLEVDVAEEPGPPPEGGKTQTDGNGLATFHIKPGTYYIYFNSLGFPTDLEYPQPETIQIQQNIVNKHTIVIKTKTVQISEQPDQSTFRKYFSEMGLGRLPAGGQMPFDFQKDVTIFAPGDNFRLYCTVIEDVQISARYYDATTKESVTAAAPPSPYIAGKSYVGGETLTLPVGEYEYKVYVGDVLVAVFPFEVR